MFGYVRIYKPELRIKEYEMYKAVYCTLCKKLGKEYGLLARFTLSYDFTFLALLKMALKDEECAINNGRCAFYPLKKCNYCTQNDEDFDFSVAAAMIMLYFKLVDNLNDEKGFSRLKYLLMKPAFSASYKKAKRKYPQINAIFEEYFSDQQSIESSGSENIDAASEPTAKMLSGVFAFCDSKENKALKRLGYCIGRYIYILDAAADCKTDIKKGRYNPYKNTENLKEKALNQIEFCINEAAISFEEINIKRFKNILGNIIYLGLEDTAQKELAK